MKSGFRKYILMASTALIIVNAFSFQSAEAQESAEKLIMTDKSLPSFQIELLELAFETATAIPVNPHIKDRSFAQESVVTTALELDQPQRALKYIEKIDNWRRGAGYADLAFYYARQDNTQDVQPYLDLAQKISETAEDWRRDTIKVKIARTHALLGHDQQADEFGTGITESESGKVAGAQAMVAKEDSFEDQMKTLDALIAPGNFDVIKNALESATELFNRFYDDTERRKLVEDKIRTSWEKLPIFVRVDLMLKLSGFALDHADKTKARELLKETLEMVSEAQWPVDYLVPLKGRLAGLLHRAGDVEKAKILRDEALELFKTEGDVIIDIYQAGALRPVAEAFQATGDTPGALNIYKMALERGTRNPNARPHAEDLSATLISMAKNGVEPDAELWAKIRQIKDGLKEPW